MVTRWSQELLDEAVSLHGAKRYRSALGKVLTILDVHPDQPQAHEIAAAVIRSGASRTTDASAGETLERRHLLDSRLSPIFCSCEAPGCAVSWVSAHYLTAGSQVMTTNPLGARCEACGVTLCRRHLPAPDRYGVVHGCPRCGGPLDTAPPPNGREVTQTQRLNKRLVHVVVLVEGKRAPSPDFMNELCRDLVPDVFDDDPRITGYHERKFTGNGSNLALLLTAKLSDAYLTDEYDVRVYPGQVAGRRGQRWVIVKVFENRPKHVDPDDPGSTS